MSKRKKSIDPKHKRMIQIMRVSNIGIVANLILAIFKAVVGFISGSIAIIVDAANSLSDAASSFIVLAGAKLANKRPDKKHPFGHGRFEYLGALAIGALVLYAGLTSLIESIKKIINPTDVKYDMITLAVVISAILVKIALAIYFIEKGKKLASTSLSNSGKDAVMDIAISATTLIAAIVMLVTGVSVEAYLAAIISVVILRSGFNMMREAASLVLGQRPDVKTIRSVLRQINAFDEVYGSYDLVLNNYGPNSHYGAVNIEVNEDMSASEIDALSRKISATIYKKNKIILTSIGIYAKNRKKHKGVSCFDELEGLLLAMPNILQVHGFYIDNEAKTVRFDIVVSFEEKHPDELLERVYEETSKIYPDYEIDIVVDSDYALV